MENIFVMEKRLYLSMKKDGVLSHVPLSLDELKRIMDDSCEPHCEQVLSPFEESLPSV